MAGPSKVINLKGDKNNPESAEHIITFPGGYISVTRTSNNEYWAHIGVNHKQLLEDVSSISKFGQVVENRIDYDDTGVQEIATRHRLPFINHIAVRIKTIKGKDGQLYQD